MNPYATWFSRIFWIGTVVNIGFVIALCFFPNVLLSVLNIPIPVPLIWVRIAGLLLLETSFLRIPSALDLYRYQVTAWISVVLARGGGALFFLCAVFFFSQPWGFLAIALVDLIFGIVEGIFLVLATRTEKRLMPEPTK